MIQKPHLKSISDIAKIAGVSKSTVSRALNDSPLIGIETKTRITAIAREHDFHPSTAARSLSLRSCRTIAYVIDAYDDDCLLESPFSMELMGGVATGLRELGYDMLIAQTDGKRDEWATEFLGSGKVDGFILMTYDNKNRHAKKLLDLGAPFTIWGCCDTPGCSSVISDNRRGGFLAGAHLASTGRNRLGFIGGPKDDLEVIDRLRGFLEGAGEALSPNAQAFADFDEKTGYSAMEELLDSGRNIDGVFAAGDLMAIGAMRAITARGMHVPDDISVVGYDDLYVSSFTTPALTTVSQHIADSGKTLARNLVSQIERHVVTSSIVPVELIRRKSG